VPVLFARLLFARQSRIGLARARVTGRRFDSRTCRECGCGPPDGFLSVSGDFLDSICFFLRTKWWRAESPAWIRLADLLRDPRRRSDRFGRKAEDHSTSSLSSRLQHAFLLFASCTATRFPFFARPVRGSSCWISTAERPLVAESEMAMSGSVSCGIPSAFPSSGPMLFSFSFLHFSEPGTSSRGFHVARRLSGGSREMSFVFRSKIQLARALTKKGGKRKMEKKKMKNPDAYFSSRGPF